MLLLIVGLVAIGSATGYWAQNEYAAQRTSPDPATVTVPPPPTGGGDGVVMRDVRGMTESDARQTLIDEGIATTVVTVRAEPAAGAPGKVIKQTPASQTPNPTKIELVVSAEARMPDPKGRTGQELSVELQKLGAQVTVANRYQPGAKPGTVLDSTPKSGAVLPDAVALTVAEPGSSLYLADVSTISGSCSSGKYSLNGKDYEESLSCSAGTSSPSEYEWLSKRAVDEVTATVGIADDEDRRATARIEVLADGAVVADVTARYGAPAALTARTTNALRITIRVTRIGSTSADAILGDARFIGSADIQTKLSK